MVWRLHCFKARQTVSREGHGRGPHLLTETRSDRQWSGTRGYKVRQTSYPFSTFSSNLFVCLFLFLLDTVWVIIWEYTLPTSQVPSDTGTGKLLSTASRLGTDWASILP